MQTIAGPNTNALRSITGYNTGSPLRKNKVQLTDQQAGSAAAGAASLATDVSAIASDQIPAQSAKGEGGRILGETAKYAGMGMAFGPIVAGVGALVGLTVGLIKNKKAKDAYKDQLAENKKIENASKAQAALSANVNSQNQDTMPYKSNITKKMSPIPYGSSIKMSNKEYEASKLMMQVSGASELQYNGGDEEYVNTTKYTKDTPLSSIKGNTTRALVASARANAKRKEEEQEAKEMQNKNT